MNPSVAASSPGPLPPRILVVDDAEEVRQLHARVLRGSGMTVVTAEDGNEALDTARSVAPDVVVTDVDMPVMDGVELCRHLRADAATCNTVVIVVTGDPSESGRAALEAGCNAVLGKPCSGALLLETIQRLLDASRLVNGPHGLPLTSGYPDGL